jgi:hypothetical protein
MLNPNLGLREDYNETYKPDVLVLMLSSQCNINCSHCIVNWWPKNKDKMSKKTINNAIQEASRLWFTQVLLYWWEPFLQINDLLPYGIEEGLEKWMLVQINTNWFWWKSEKVAKRNFDKIQEIAQRKEGMVAISLSVDTYHKEISPESISNLIKNFRLSNYENIRLWINTFSGEESDENGFHWALEKVYQQLLQENIFLIQDGHKQGFIYPAQKEEFIYFCEENFPKICEKLKIDKSSDRENILKTVSWNIRLKTQKVMARKFDFWEWEKQYLIFPEEKKIITLNVFEGVTKAWKSKVWEKTEVYPDNFDWEHNSLIIWPNNMAYMFPSQISEDIAWVKYTPWDLQGTIHNVKEVIENLIKK